MTHHSHEACLHGAREGSAGIFESREPVAKRRRHVRWEIQGPQLSSWHCPANTQYNRRTSRHRSTTPVATIPSVRSSFTGAPFDPFALDALRTALQGVALTPGDDGYADASACWSVLIRHEPAIAVMAETTDDVILAVRFANAHDLPIAVQGTGHGQPTPCVGGMLVNTSRMQGVTIFPQARRARAEAGVKWESVVPLAHEHGLAPLAGSTTDVGVVGYTLGGGHGWLARKYGRA